MTDEDQQVRELFREAAKKEGKSLRQWCRDNGIVYDTLIGREIPSDTPLSVVYDTLIGREIPSDTPLSAIHDHDGTYFGVCPACAKE